MGKKPGEVKTRQGGDKPEAASEWEAPTGRNVIVAIGINEYQHHASLDNPITDALAMLDLFKQCGFQELPGVRSLVTNNATRDAIAALPDRLAAELKADDNLVLFFAGHGDRIERETPDPYERGKTRVHRTGFLIPVDGPKDSPSKWIRLDAFLDDLSSLPARHIFVILDACKSGIALGEKFRFRGGEERAALSELRWRPSRRVMTSAMHDQKATDAGSGSGHSLFVEALIEAIQDRQADKDEDDFVKTWDVFSFVQDRVSDRAKALYGLKQTPDYGQLPGDGSGDLVISLRDLDMDPETRERAEFKRLIGQEVESWRRFGTMLSSDKLALISTVATELALNAESQELVLRSALALESAVPDWVVQAIDPEQQVAILSTTVQSKDSQVRLNSADVLGRLGATATALTPQVTGLLTTLMSDDSQAVQRKAVATLGQVLQVAGSPAAPEASQVLMRLLVDKDEGLRHSAANTLGAAIASTPEIRPQAADALVDLLVDDSVDERISATYAVGQIAAACPEAITMVAEGLATRLLDERQSIRRNAANGLARIIVGRMVQPGLPATANHQVVQTLAELITDDDEHTRMRAIEGLEILATADPELGSTEIMQRLTARLDDPEPEVRDQAMQSIGNIVQISPQLASPEVGNALVERLGDEKRHLGYRAAEVLGQVAKANPEVITSQTEQSLLRLLGGARNARAAAAYSITQIGAAKPELANRQLVRALVGLLGDADMYVRTRAANALSQMAAVNAELAEWLASETIALMANRDHDVDLRRRAGEISSQVLGTRSTVVAPETVDVLLKLIHEPDGSIRRAAAEVLGNALQARPEMGPQVLPILARRLTISEGTVRRETLDALQQVALLVPAALSEETIAALTKLQNDEDEMVRAKASIVLRRIKATVT